MGKENFIIAAGGTGAMCARAFIYMAAAGCAENDDTYHILLVDKDKQSDAVTACDNLLRDYQAMRVQMGHTDGTNTFPEIKVHKWNFTDEIVAQYHLQTGEPAAALDALTLEKLLNPSHDRTMRQILKTMYTQEELDTNLEKGFYGHPNIGSPVFAYVRSRFLADKVTMADGTVRDNTFMQELRRVMMTTKAHVYLMGSLFGGTGATVIPNMVLALRSIMSTDPIPRPIGKTNLILGSSVIMPYFKLPVCPADSVEAISNITPADTKFEGQTRDALKYYHESNLLENVMNLTLLGTSHLDVTSELFARGGVQTQHFHIVLLLAATAANRFFADKLGKMAERVNVGPADPVVPRGELLVWKGLAQNEGQYSTLSFEELDLVEEGKKLNQFLRFSVVVGVYMRLLFNQSAENVKNFNEVRGTWKQMHRNEEPDLNMKPKQDKKFKLGKKLNLNEEPDKDDVEKYYKGPVDQTAGICRGFIQFLYDVALSGYDWSGYHTKTKTEDGKGLYSYAVTDAVEIIAPSQFHTRWVDFANLDELRELLENGNLLAICQSKTLKDICSFHMVDANRAVVREEKYEEHIASVYEDALNGLGLVRNFFGIQNTNVYFSQIYDEIRKKV